QRFLDCGVDRAVGVVNDLMTARVRQFQHVAASELPALAEQHGLDAGTRAALDVHVRALEDWMAGVLRWHQTTTRYQERELRRTPSAPDLFALTGLGTSAARVGPA